MARSTANPSFLLVVGSLLAFGCAKADTLTIKPGTPAPPELLPSNQLEEFAYKRVLLLPYEGEVVVKDFEPAPLSKKQKRKLKKKGGAPGPDVPPTQSGAYYTAKVEKALLSQGFDLVSSEIVARAAKDIKGGEKLTGAEKALVMGKQTKADAVFLIQSISIEGETDYYAVEKLNATKVDPKNVKLNEKKGRFYETETKDCVFRLPYYTMRMEAKLIDSHTGNVLWVGSGKHTVIDALTESYVAKLDKKCGIDEENFVFQTHIVDENQLAATFAGLTTQLVEPLKKDALKGKPIPEDKPKVVVKEPEPPPKPEPEPPKVPTAVVSTNKATMRAGPGKKNEKMRTVSRKTKVEVIESMGEWHKVKLQDGAIGWMHESTLIMNE